MRFRRDHVAGYVIPPPAYGLGSSRAREPTTCFGKLLKAAAQSNRAPINWVRRHPSWCTPVLGAHAHGPRARGTCSSSTLRAQGTSCASVVVPMRARRRPIGHARISRRASPSVKPADRR
eukprot:1889583-Prymnesium_polylepis.1